jgi:hypothetical protein
VLLKAAVGGIGKTMSKLKPKHFITQLQKWVKTKMKFNKARGERKMAKELVIAKIFLLQYK